MSQDDPDGLDAVVYCRTDSSDVSTLRPQIAACLDECAARVLDGTVSDTAIDGAIDELRRRDAGQRQISQGGVGVVVDVNGSSRDFQAAADLIKDRSVGHLVVPASASPEVDALVETAVDERVACHLVPGPWSDGTVGMSDIMIHRAGPGEEWSGRPPLGYDVECGRLVPGDEFESVVATLRLVEQGRLSKRSAADEIGTSRRTITRCLESPGRYLLDD